MYQVIPNTGCICTIFVNDMSIFRGNKTKIELFLYLCNHKTIGVCQAIYYE